MDDVTIPDDVIVASFTFGAGLGVATISVETAYGLSTTDAMTMLLAGMLLAAVDHPEWAQAWKATFDPNGVLRHRVVPLLVSCLPIAVVDEEDDDDRTDTTAD